MPKTVMLHAIFYSLFIYLFITQCFALGEQFRFFYLSEYDAFQISDPLLSYSQQHSILLILYFIGHVGR